MIFDMKYVNFILKINLCNYHDVILHQTNFVCLIHKNTMCIKLITTFDIKNVGEFTMSITISFAHYKIW
jgi:hypothetical protein